MREATERAVLRVAGAWLSVALVYLLSAEAVARVMVILLGYLPLCVVRMVMRVTVSYTHLTLPTICSV